MPAAILSKPTSQLNPPRHRLPDAKYSVVIYYGILVASNLSGGVNPQGEELKSVRTPSSADRRTNMQFAPIAHDMLTL